MEMVKEVGQPNQPHKTMEEEEDRISLLPDCLLIEIICRLDSTKQAIKTGVLSKRWQHLWKFVHTLIFPISDYYLEFYGNLSDFYSCVDKTLTQLKSNNLNKFKLDMEFKVRYQARVNRWIRYAISCNVEEMYLTLRPTKKVALYSKTKTKFQLKDEYIFNNSCFTHLALESCVFNPTGPISWTKLKSLHISQVELNEDLIQNILSGSPLLETLKLENCYRSARVDTTLKLDITSKSVKNLEVFGYSIHEGNNGYYHDNAKYNFDELCELSSYEDEADTIEINAPYILSLNIEGYLDTVKLVLLDVSSLVRANLDYTMERGDYGIAPEEWQREMLKAILLSLPHVTELQLGDECSWVLSNLKDEGFVCPLEFVKI